MITSKTSRRSFLGSLGSLTAFAWPLSRLAGAIHYPKSIDQKSRNIILILSDDHRYDFMSFLGKPDFLETPHMDRLARDGAHLSQAFVSTSLCSPSRASILTGQYAHKHGVVDNNVDIPPGTLFFPQLLQQAG
ncbi:MAG: acetylglucosamine-6-sulfatase, partial [Calditrichaeota bacterium]